MNPVTLTLVLFLGSIAAITVFLQFFQMPPSQKLENRVVGWRVEHPTDPAHEYERDPNVGVYVFKP